MSRVNRIGLHRSAIAIEAASVALSRAYGADMANLKDCDEDKCSSQKIKCRAESAENFVDSTGSKRAVHQRPKLLSEFFYGSSHLSRWSVQSAN